MVPETQSVARILTAASRGLVALALALCCAFNAGAPAAAFPGVVVFDPTNLEKNMQTAINTLKQVAQQAQMIQNQIQQIRQQALMLSQLPKDQLAYVNDQWKKIQSDLSAFSQVIQVKGAVNVMDKTLGDQFQQKFRGYVANHDYLADRYQLDETTLATIQSSIQAVGLQAQGLDSDIKLADTLRQLAKTPAAGQMQALQAGNEIAAAELKELVQIRQLQIAQIQSEKAYEAKITREHQQQTLTDAQQQQLVRNFWSESPTPTPAPH